MTLYSQDHVVEVYGSAEYCFSGDTSIELFVTKESDKFLHGYEAHYNIQDKQYELLSGKITISKSSVNGFKREPKFIDVPISDKHIKENPVKDIETADDK